MLHLDPALNLQLKLLLVLVSSNHIQLFRRQSTRHLWKSTGGCQLLTYSLLHLLAHLLLLLLLFVLVQKFVEFHALVQIVKQLLLVCGRWRTD